jgi:hypothetical protein
VLVLRRGPFGLAGIVVAARLLAREPRKVSGSQAHPRDGRRRSVSLLAWPPLNSGGRAPAASPQRGSPAGRLPPNKASAGTLNLSFPPSAGLSCSVDGGLRYAVAGRSGCASKGERGSGAFPTETDAPQVRLAPTLIRRPRTGREPAALFRRPAACLRAQRLRATAELVGPRGEGSCS